jgi:hypothetical protein
VAGLIPLLLDLLPAARMLGLLGLAVAGLVGLSLLRSEMRRDGGL